MKKKKTECILWPGSKNTSGYGQVRVGGKMRMAHRVQLEIKLKRRLSSNEIVLHLCHTRSCINPDHLEVGDKKTNRMHSRRRQSSLADTHLKGWDSIYKKTW